MPNSFAGLAQRFPAEKEGQSVEDQVKELRDYSYQLLEYLRYAMQHLDPSNFNETEMEEWITKPIRAQIEDVNGNMSQLALTAEQLAVRMENAEGDVSQLQQTAQSLSSTVASQDGAISSVQQTAQGIQSTVADLNGKYSKLQQTVNGFDFTGLVTFDDLTDEDTTISGDCITTGTIKLKRLDLSNSYGSLEISSGSNGVQGTVGPRLTGPDEDVYFIVTNAACRMTADGNHFYVSPDDIVATEDIEIGSDRRLKNSIEYGLTDRYESMYRALKPARFKYNHGKSERFHIGFIAQEVEEAINDGGLTNQDLAALVKRSEEDGGMYAIRYGELIALNTAMIQKLMGEVDSLKKRVEELEGKP